MRCLLTAALLLVCSTSAFAQAGKDKDEPPAVFPQVGSDIPGPFSPYNATGKRKGRFHCLVTQHELNPAAMVIVRGVEMTEPLKLLLVKLDGAIEKNPNTRLAGFAVFVTDQVKDLLDPANDDKLEELEKKLEDVQRDGALKHVTLALDLKDKLVKYKFEDSVDVVVVLYSRFRTVSFHSMTRDQLTEAKVKEILGEVAEKLGAKRG